MTIPETLAPLSIPIDDVEPYPGNARRGNIDVIASSLEHNGQFRPIVANKRTMQILGGNHTWHAAKQLGWSEIAVVFVDVDDAAARRIVIADNRTNDLAAYDDRALVAMLREAENDGGLLGTAFEKSDVAALMRTLPQEGDAPLELPPEEWQIVIECDDERQQIRLLEQLQSEGLKCRALIG